MRRSVLTLALSALALFPTAALAAAPQPAVGPFDAATVTTAIAAAETLWPDNPCAGQSVVRPITSADAQQQYRMTPTTLGFATLNAWGTRSDCGFWLVSDRIANHTAADLCTVMAHELGHVLGHDHNDDPADVMYARYNGVQAPPCAAAFPAPTPAPTAQPSPAPAPAPDGGHRGDDALPDDFVPYAPVPHLASVEQHGPHQLTLTLNNPDAVGRAVVTYYRRGFILGCGGGVCNPWDLGGRIARHSASLLATNSPTVRAPRGWTIATVQIKEPGTRQGVIAGFTPDRVKHKTPAPKWRCEFTPC